MESELTHQLGYEKDSPTGTNSGNNRNGKYKKGVKSKHGETEIS